jgi:hypothetical protein
MMRNGTSNANKKGLQMNTNETPKTATRKLPVYREMAIRIDALKRCVAANNEEWTAKHNAVLKGLADMLPHGSGFDCGCTIDFNASTGEKLVITTEYHHMDDNGMYDGWTSHVVTVKASLLHGFTITINGRDKNGFKDYAYDLLNEALSDMVTDDMVKEWIDKA